MKKQNKSKKNISIQTLLSFAFILISVVILVLTGIIYSLYQFNLLRKNTIENLNNTCSSIADSFDQQFNQMNQISLNVISSSDLFETFEEYRMPSSGYEHNQARLKLAGIMTSLKGFDFSVRQVNLYDTTCGGYGIGEENGEIEQAVSDMDWYDAAISQAGKLVISVTDDGYLSAARLFYDRLHRPNGFVEILKYYDDVFLQASRPETAYPVSVYVFDSSGVCLFPHDEDRDIAADVPAEYLSAPESIEGRFLNPRTGRKEYMAYARSDRHKMLVLAVISQDVFLQQVLRFLPWMLAVFLVLLALSLVISAFLSRRIASPIKHIYHFLSRKEEDRFQLLEMPDTNIREIEKLKTSINDNIRSTKESTDTLMILKEQEVQAQMLALQSQMNPHFLFNSLSTISAMAREGLTEPVSRMCLQITEIMRYISSNREQRSGLEEELEICDMYLDCIRMRYGDSLQSSIRVEDEMLDYQVPKLCIQLLVENAVKSVTTQSPPWQISIDGHTKDGHWYVTVSDNGPCFDPEVETDLRRQMDQILEKGILPSLKIEGMGILNIFIRLYLLDGISFIFDMGNLPDGGAFVTIGGKIK